MAADHLRLRGGDLHRRPRPGRGTGARSREGAARRHQAGERVHRGPSGGVRSRLRVPDVPRQHGVRRAIPARHVNRTAADREKADRDRAQGRRRRRLSRRHRKRQRSGAVRAELLRARAVDQDRRAMAGMDVQGPRGTLELRARAPDHHRQRQGGRSAVLGRRQPAALLVRGQGAGRSSERSAVDRLSAHHLADGGARPADRNPDRLRARRRGEFGRPEAFARDAACPAQ